MSRAFGGRSLGMRPASSSERSVGSTACSATRLPSALSRALSGLCFAQPERQGKLLICFTEREPTLVLHFGMTGTFVFSEGGPRRPHLTADEALWQARIDPTRRAETLDDSERRALYSNPEGAAGLDPVRARTGEADLVDRGAGPPERDVSAVRRAPAEANGCRAHHLLLPARATPIASFRDSGRERYSIDGSRTDRAPRARAYVGKSSNVLLSVLIVLVIPAMVCGLLLLAGAVRRRRARELRGDWWPDFERQFRAYAQRAASDHGRSQL
jgi:hypothetical protein